MAYGTQIGAPYWQFLDSNGNCAVGYKLYTYQVGTTTDQDTYPSLADAVASTNANPNPFILNTLGNPASSSGGSPLGIWINTPTKFVLKDADDVTVHTLDNVGNTVYVAEGDDLLDSNGNTIIGLNEQGSSVNYLDIANAATGSNPNISVRGSDATRNLDVGAKASGTQYVVVSLSSVPTAVNFAQIRNSATGNGINIDSIGGDDNIDININPKGTGVLNANADVLNIITEDSRTNTVDLPLAITSTTDGTPAAGIGTGIQLSAESADENPSVFGEMAFAASDVSAGSEDTYFSIATRTAGAAVSTAYKFDVTDTGNYSFTGAPSAERTMTLPNRSMTVSGSWILLAESTISSDSTIDFTDLSSTYSTYVFELLDIVPGTDAQDLYLQTSTDNGSNFDAGSTDYHFYQEVFYEEQDAQVAARSAGAAAINLVVGLGSASNEVSNGFVYLHTPSSATYTSVQFYFSTVGAASTQFRHHSGGGYRYSAADVDAIRFLMSSGNLASGTIKVYGIGT